MSELKGRVFPLLRDFLFLDATVFLVAALLNAGISIPLGFAELRFGVPIWQAGLGEAVIGLALLAGALTGRTTLAWVGFWMSVIGIVIGLSAARVQGLARDIHVVLVPLAVIVFGLLVWGRRRDRRPGDEACVSPTSTEVANGAPRGTANPRRQPILIALRALLVLASVAFAVASLVHFGVVINLGPLQIDDPFAGAAIPEAVIAVVLGVGAVAAIAWWPEGWPLTLATTLFSLVLTIYGLTVTVRSSRTGDIAYHVAILILLVVIAGLLFMSKRRRR